MARLLENDSLSLLANEGIRLPRWGVASSAVEAEATAARLKCAVVLKALVPVGGRGKAGAIRSASNPAEAAAATAELLARHVGEFPVRRVLVMERLQIAEEQFASFTFDPAAKGPVLLFSRSGGVEVERQAGRAPGSLLRRAISVTRGFRPFEGRDVAVEAGLRGSVVPALGQLLASLYRVFRGCDARLVEINPLALTVAGELLPAAVVIDLDDQALFRHIELGDKLAEEEGTGFRPFTPLERRIHEIDRSDPHAGAIRFLEFPDGDIAFMVTSGGAALTALGQLISLGGRPANAFDITAGQNEEKIYLAMRAILRRPGLRGLIAGGNVKNFARVDLQVRGIVRALRDEGVDPRRFPVVLRFAGPGIEEAREIARNVSGLEFYEDETSLEGAVRRIVERTGR
ncbi:MAG: acetate--CoA ligase family protein [Candidatus Rokubacteria bacterium]|nr:acetate--CoA ligase family protein [Candidatus Rokubacteria bacterium]